MMELFFGLPEGRRMQGAILGGRLLHPPLPVQRSSPRDPTGLADARD